MEVVGGEYCVYVFCCDVIIIVVYFDCDFYGDFGVWVCGDEFNGFGF